MIGSARGGMVLLDTVSAHIISQISWETKMIENSRLQFLKGSVGGNGVVRKEKFLRPIIVGRHETPAGESLIDSWTQGVPAWELGYIYRDEGIL